MHTGSCLCGSVRFEITGDLGPAVACHCSQCRRQSGHFFVSTEIARPALVVHGSENLTWHRSSEKAQRGFCAKCGSFLFWDPFQRDSIAVAMGAFDPPTNTELKSHIHVADKGDYYELADGLPEYA